jgi:hypothetical protein
MNIEHFERNIKTIYKNLDTDVLQNRIEALLSDVSKEWDIQPKDLTMHELKVIASTILDQETKSLHDEIEELIAQQEHIQRLIDKKSHQLQNSKYDIFNTLEEVLHEAPQTTISKLHQIKFQSIDLFDILSEMIESALITTLEKNDSDIKETLEEIIKDITYETLNEGPINGIRIRKILSTILQTAVNVAEATPNQATELLTSSLRGMRSGLIKSITKFKQTLLNVPDEVRLLVISDYTQTIDELNHADILFTQVINYIGNANTKETRHLLEEIQNGMKYDLQELVFVSKETVAVMRERLKDFKRDALQKGSKVLKSQKAQEAKRMGKQAWGVAKTALGSAIKTAKNAIDKKDKN